MRDWSFVLKQLIFAFYILYRYKVLVTHAFIVSAHENCIFFCLYYIPIGLQLNTDYKIVIMIGFNVIKYCIIFG